MKNNMVLTLLALIVGLFSPAAANWKLDNAHSKVKFSVTHLLISDVEGTFKTFGGTLDAPKPDFSDGAVQFSVDVASVNTENDMRDKHLQSDDFFNAEKYPKMEFKSVSWKKIDDRNVVLEGDLTIRNVTKRVAFNVALGGTVKDPWGSTRVGFKATTVINRFDFNLKWNKLAEAGAVVGKDVAITMNLEFIQQQDATPGSSGTALK